MKNPLVLAPILALMLAACGQEQQPASDTDGTADEPPTAATEAASPAAEPAADGDATPTLVEESAADAVDEADDADVPLLLAQAENSARRDWKFKEGQHFTRLVPTQPTVGGADKVEVAEVFWYGCAHCADFEPFVNRWLEEKPANARLVRIPAMWNPLVRLHAQLYYTEEVLAKNGKIAEPEAFRAAVFREYHQRNNRLANEDAIKALFGRFGVSAADFDKTWNSFEVAQKLRVAEDLARRYGIASVPTVVVNGKYRTDAGDAGSYPQLIELINELVARETAR